MKLKALASKPVLLHIVLDDEKIIELYDEPIEFWMWDRQDIDVYLKIAQTKEDYNELLRLVKALILDDTGAPMLKENEILPMEVVTPLVAAVVKNLGNLKSQTSKTPVQS